jgi:hypothetical protein
MFNSNQAFLLVQKFEISPKGFTLGVKANVQLKSSIPNGAKVEIGANLSGSIFKTSLGC